MHTAKAVKRPVGGAALLVCHRKAGASLCASRIDRAKSTPCGQGPCPIQTTTTGSSQPIQPGPVVSSGPLLGSGR